MPNQEFIQQKQKYWEEFLQKHEISRADGVTADAFIMAFDRAYALGREKEAITQEEIEKASEEFADKEYMTNQYERDALYKGYYHGMKDALSKQEKVIAQEEIEKAWQDYAEEIGLPDSLNYATRPMIEIAIKQAFKSGANFSLGK